MPYVSMFINVTGFVKTFHGFKTRPIIVSKDRIFTESGHCIGLTVDFELFSFSDGTIGDTADGKHLTNKYKSNLNL